MEFHFEASHRDLEQTIHAAVVALAAERGVSVKETRLELQAGTGRVLDFKVACKVRAAIVTASLVMRGRAAVGDDLCARFDELLVEGEGVIASLARTAIEPQLAALRSRALSLAGLKLPGLRVSDVAIAAGERVRLTVTLAPAGDG